MISTHLRALLVAGTLGSLLPCAGCSQPAEPEKIEGKTPADFREEIEKQVTKSGVPVAPKAPARK